MKLLIINPGATSTKIAVFEDEEQLFKVTIDHSAEELDQFPRVIDQAGYRKEAILKAIGEAGYQLGDFAAVCGRGGLYRPIPSGTYAVNDKVMADVEAAPYGEHPSNLGAYLAKKLGDMVGIPAFFVDPVCVDEMTEVAHYTGFSEFRRLCQFHALNHKAVGRRAAKELGKKYEDVNLIVCHLGGGVSVGAHEHGRVVDVCNVKDEGSMGMDRAGGLPVNQLISYCFSGKTKDEVKRTFGRRAGMFSYLGTTDFRVVCAKVVEATPRPWRPIRRWCTSWPRTSARWRRCCTSTWTPSSIRRAWPTRISSATTSAPMSARSRPSSGCRVRRRCALWRRARCGCSGASRRPRSIDLFSIRMTYNA